VVIQNALEIVSASPPIHLIRTMSRGLIRTDHFTNFIPRKASVGVREQQFTHPCHHVPSRLVRFSSATDLQTRKVGLSNRLEEKCGCPRPTRKSEAPAGSRGDWGLGLRSPGRHRFR